MDQRMGNLFRGVLGLSSLGSIAAVFYGGTGWMQILPVSLCALGWPALIWLDRRESQPENEIQETGIHEAEVEAFSEATSALLGSMGKVFGGQFDNIKGESLQVQDILSDAIERLLVNFTELERQSRHQRELACTLAGGAGSGVGSDLSYEALWSEVQDLLQGLVAAAEGNARASEDLVAMMETANGQVKQVLRAISQIKDIAEQINVLSINATIEAAGAGEYGRGFAVVAQEVRSLSVHANRFSKEISSQVSGIEKALIEVETSIQSMAERETRAAETTATRVSALTEQSQSFSRSIESSAVKISEISGDVEGRVRQVVTALQFQDMATQVLGAVSGRVSVMGGVLEDVAKLRTEESRSEEPLDGLRRYRDRLAEAALLVEQACHNPVSNRNLHQGEIELF